MTAPVFERLVGQESLVQELARAARDAASMTHAWLFTGPAGSGRSVAARAFAAALLCSQQSSSDDGPGCGQCHDCRTALAGSHADITIEATEATIIPVGRARELALTAAHRPAAGRWRIIIVEDADRLNEQASDALLKALEEPAPRTVWLLCAPSVDDLLVTVRSRCRHVRLRTPSTEVVSKLLVSSGVDESMAAFAARAAQSHVGIARRLATDPDARGRRSEITAIPMRLHGLGDALRAAELLHTTAADAAASEDVDTARRAYIAQLGGDPDSRTQPPAIRAGLRGFDEDAKRRGRRRQFDSIDAALTDLASVYRDALMVAAGAKVELVNCMSLDGADGSGGRRSTDADAVDPGQIQGLADTMSPEDLLGALDRIGLARGRLVANGSPLLVLEAMMIGLILPERR